jgi:hypothetical protein
MRETICSLISSLPDSNGFDVIGFFGLVYLHFQARNDLLILLSGSRFFAGLVSFAFIPFILAQKDFFLAASLSVLGLGAGGFRLPPVALL